MTTTDDLLTLADPVPAPPATTDEDVARVVRVAVARGDASAARRLHPDAPRRRRLVVGVAGVSVAAAAVSVAVGVLPQGERLGVRTPPAAADPVAVLRAAATAATTATAVPFTAPRPDQFVYVDDGSGYRAWLSVDGTHDGLVDNGTVDGAFTDPGCRDGVALVSGNYEGVRPVPCTPDPVYRPDVPTDPTALRTWLAVEGNGSETNDVAKEVLYLLGTRLLTPAARAALFTVVSSYDGLTVTGAGLPNDLVGVTWSFGGGSTTLVFDRVDHDYRGTLAPDGTVTAETMTVVDVIGETG